MSVLNKPKIEAYIGSTGSGKGVSVNARLAELQPARLLVWDPRGEYKRHAQEFRTVADLAAAFAKAKAGPIRARFVPGGAVKLADAFAAVCRIAFAAGELVFVAEELSDTTTASFAPAAWRQVITQGRHRGLHVIGCAQRPALIDKTFLGNATFVRCFNLRYHEDRVAMAKALDADLAKVQALQTVEQGGRVTINYIERDWTVPNSLRTGHKRLSR